jgi:hypothetical protein
MIENFSIAQIIDAVIVFTLVECAALVLYHRRTGRGVAVRDFFANMVSGLCLMFALRCLATDASAATVALLLLAAGMAHAVDILMRWKRTARNTSVTRSLNA